MSDFLEKTLEDIIVSNLDKMPSRGLDIFYKNTASQISFGAGIIDIFTWEEIDDVLHCRIIELKKDCVQEDAFWQAFNYKIDLFIFLSQKYKYIKDIKIELVLIGPSFKENVLFISSYAGLKCYEYRYGIDGIAFLEQDIYIEDDFIKKGYDELVAKGKSISKTSSFTDIASKMPRGKSVTI